MPLSLTSTVTTQLLQSVSALNTSNAPSLPQANLTLGLVVELVIAVLVGGHSLLLTTIALYKPWNIADLLIFSLSMADAINAAIPLQLLNVLNNFLGPHLWTQASCAVFVILTYTFRIASVFTITLISANRAVLLTRPLQHHIIVTIGRARKAVTAIWLFSVFMAILPFIGVGQPGYRGGYCFYQLFDFGIVYGYIIESIGILQLALVLICFIAIKVTSGKFVKRQYIMAASRQTGGKNQQERETAGTRQVKQLSFMMGVVVLLYYISWLPYLLINLYSMVTGQINHSQVILMGFFSLVNALINPILYAKMSQRYRKGYIYIFKKILSVCGGAKPDGSFFEATLRNASKLNFSTVSTHYSNARKSVDFSHQEGGLLSRPNEKRNDHLTRKTGARFETNQEQDKYEKDVENNNQDNFAVAEGNNGNVVNLDTSSLAVSLRNENDKLKKSSADNDASVIEESFDSVL